VGKTLLQQDTRQGPPADDRMLTMIISVARD
jgi:hypothetical protein